MSAESSDSFQDAVKRGAEKAAERLDHGQSIRVESHEVTVNDATIQSYKVHLKVSFQMRD